jgi:hypothetical protein
MRLDKQDLVDFLGIVLTILISGIMWNVISFEITLAVWIILFVVIGILMRKN